jgi:hypothetical protein
VTGQKGPPPQLSFQPGRGHFGRWCNSAGRYLSFVRTHLKAFEPASHVSGGYLSARTTDRQCIGGTIKKRPCSNGSLGVPGTNKGLLITALALEGEKKKRKDTCSPHTGPLSSAAAY